MRYLLVILFLCISALLYAQQQTGIDTTQKGCYVYKTAFLPPLTPDELDHWQYVMDKQQGIMGNDFWGKQEIGTAGLRRPLTFARKWYWTWLKPYIRKQDMGKAYKQTLCGTIVQTYHTLSSKAESLFFEDNDLSLHISPDKDFAYMLDQVPTIERSLECELDMKDIIGLDCLHCGHTAHQTNDNVCVYGVWANDAMHQTFLLTVEIGMAIKKKDHVEIHPREQTWWKKQYNDTTRYYCLLAADASKRFFDPERLDPYHGTQLGAWATTPMLGVFALAFEKKIAQKTLHYVLNWIDDSNAQIINPNAYTQYMLLADSDTVAIMDIPAAVASYYKVSFYNIGIDVDNNVKGFMAIESAVGAKGATPQKDMGGHLFYWVEQISEKLKIKN